MEGCGEFLEKGPFVVHISVMRGFLFCSQFSAVDVDQPFFQPYPSEIVFQNYMPSETYEVPLVLRNNDKVTSAKAQLSACLLLNTLDTIVYMPSVSTRINTVNLSF